MRCKKPVSSEVPEGTTVRAWVECPACIKKHADQDVQDACRLLREALELLEDG